ncbi:hypothetical protein FGG08_003109 [Glutinoglossum americanum]|uniref:Ethanolamine kinase n=1 Tax=Glutinoglossum americanum TaxID=1670608 RepID=A0A9P8I8D5_9PEZI|nr:hypothetical protein FGG08_003109 [Glutinoglossum americanum]
METASLLLSVLSIFNLVNGTSSSTIDGTTESGYIYKNVSNASTPTLKSGSGIYLMMDDGQQILDASCGAAVSSIGHGNARVKAAIAAQLDQVSYCHPGFFKTSIAERLADFLVKSTHGQMSRALLTGSGSEAVEAALKLARQYFLELSPPQPTRSRFISRKSSWHGCTIAALSMGDFKVRKDLFAPLLPGNVSRVSACNIYRDLREGEKIKDYVARLAGELEDEFQRLGPKTVCAFVAEPVAGSALGCATAVTGYFRAMKEVCDRHGALLIFDEIMCGMGRIGTLHAWEQEGVVPDISAIGKSLGCGYGTVSALLINERVVSALRQGRGYFAHGQTYQTHPLACAAALEVQHIIQEEGLVENVRLMGIYLEYQLRRRLSDHPNVGDIRGRGLFWGIELVANKMSKEPLDPALKVASKIHLRGLQRGYDVAVFPATGCADGWIGDQILLAPPFIVREADVDEIVDRYLPLSYAPLEPSASALRLILAIFPSWEDPDGEVEITRLTEGTTNTLFKVANKRPGLSKEQVDDEAVLLRVYGKGTDALVDRESRKKHRKLTEELKFHSILSRHNLAPPLLARFENGHAYQFVRGHVCPPSDLARENMWRGVARRLGEWHAVLPVASVSAPINVKHAAKYTNTNFQTPSSSDQHDINHISPYSITPNIWTVMQKWILALPNTTPMEKARGEGLQDELERLVKELGQQSSECLVLGHGDLLSGNIIIEPRGEGQHDISMCKGYYANGEDRHATFCPAAFDLANHFAEWGGFECDYNLLPTRSVRRAFLHEYLRSYRLHSNVLQASEEDVAMEVGRLFDEVDNFRGVPGFYWLSLCALLQANTLLDEIDFDYAAYAELRLKEFRQWRAEVDSTRSMKGEEMPLRERKWAQEV